MNLNSLLHVSRSGINGLQKHMDVTSNNIANVNTTGYKEKQISFRELLNNPTTAEEVDFPENTQNLGFNRGVTIEEQGVNFSQGSFTDTQSAYDFAIEGAGFFGVREASGELLLTREGNFGRDVLGQLVNQRGQVVEMATTVPYQQWPEGTPSVDSYGNVSIVNGDNNYPVGQILLFMPENSDDLVADGSNLFRVANEANLQTSLTNPNAFGNIRQASLENSNVDLAKSMTDMIATQRAYTLNTRVLQSTDDMLSTVNRFTE